MSSQVTEVGVVEADRSRVVDAHRQRLAVRCPFEHLRRPPVRLEAAADLAFGLETLQARERHADTEATLRKLMLYDPLSGLPNRAHLRQLLAA